MNLTISVFRQYNWFVAHCVEYALATQGGSEDEAMDNMREAIELHLATPTSSSQASEPIEFDRPLSFKHVRLRLQACGFDGIEQRPNHAKFTKTKGEKIRTAILPHYTELTPAVLTTIAQHSGLSKGELDQV